MQKSLHTRPQLICIGPVHDPDKTNLIIHKFYARIVYVTDTSKVSLQFFFASISGHKLPDFFFQECASAENGRS